MFKNFFYKQLLVVFTLVTLTSLSMLGCERQITEGIVNNGISGTKPTTTETTIPICAIGSILMPGEMCSDPGTDAVFAVETNGYGKYTSESGLEYGATDVLDATGTTLNDREYSLKAIKLENGNWEIQNVTDPTSDGGTVETSSDVTATASLVFSPASVVSPTVGEHIKFDINIIGDATVTAYDCFMQFDTTALRYVSTTDAGYLPDIIFIEELDDNTIHFYGASPGKNSGDGKLVTLTFEVIEVKESTLTLFPAILIGEDEIVSDPLKIINAQITIP